MKTPPALDPDELRQSLEATYGVPVRAVQFIPRGDCSWGYRVEGENGRVFFLKLFRNHPLPAWAARLTYRLRVDRGIESVPHPLPDRSGELITSLCGRPAALFDFVEGPMLFQVQEKGEALVRLGELLARIHACTKLRPDCPRVETFEMLGSGSYDQVIRATWRETTRTEAAREALRLLQPVRERLAALGEEIRLFQEKARAAPSVYRICHGDPTPGNVLVGVDGTPYLIDWDDVILAPPERDLVFWEKDEVFFAGQPTYPVMDGYRAIAGEITLDPDITGFYHRQWTVGEIAEFGHRLLFETHHEAQVASDLEDLREELNWIG